MCGFIVWLGIAISHYRFRKGYIAQGYKLEDLALPCQVFPICTMVCLYSVFNHYFRTKLSGSARWQN